MNNNRDSGGVPRRDSGRPQQGQPQNANIRNVQNPQSRQNPGNVQNPRNIQNTQNMQNVRGMQHTQSIPNQRNMQNPQNIPNRQGMQYTQTVQTPRNMQNTQSVPNPGAQNRSARAQGQPIGNQRRNPAPKVKNVPLTPEQKAKQKRDRQRERHRRSKAIGAAFRTFLIRFIVFVLLFVLLGAASAGAFYLNLTARDSEDSSGYGYEIGEDSYTLGYTDAVRDGRLFVSFSDIAEYCDFATVGSLDDIKFVVKGDEAETIRFVTGSHTVYVNEIETRLPAESYMKDTELYVPLDFVRAYVKGLTVEVNERTHKVKINRTEDIKLDPSGNPIESEAVEYQPISFLLAAPTPMKNIDEDTANEFIPMPDMGFVTNLSLYEEYMNPGSTNEYLILVNKQKTLDSTYVPADLTGIENTRDDGRDRQMMRTYPAKALEALFLEMEAAGFTDVDVTSGYRSYSYQEYLFNQRLQMESHRGDGAYEAAAAVVNPPGSSEHQSGLCIDMHNIATGADVSFGKTEQFAWLRDNCWKFGFILRYPEDKIDKTGISYEPWHYRYVGRYHAQRMKDLGMCLEEYYAYLGLS